MAQIRSRPRRWRPALQSADECVDHARQVELLCVSRTRPDSAASSPLSPFACINACILNLSLGFISRGVAMTRDLAALALLRAVSLLRCSRFTTHGRGAAHNAIRPRRLAARLGARLLWQLAVRYGARWPWQLATLSALERPRQLAGRLALMATAQ